MQITDDTVAAARAEAKRLVKRSIASAQERQQKVARRRTTFRMAQRWAKRALMVLAVLVSLTWLASAAGLLPRYNLITDADLERLTDQVSRSPQTHEAAEMQRSDLQALSKPDQDAPSTDELQAGGADLPLGLKAEPELHSVQE